MNEQDHFTLWSAEMEDQDGWGAGAMRLLAEVLKTNGQPYDQDWEEDR